jgi:hypothetical protein
MRPSGMQQDQPQEIPAGLRSGRLEGVELPDLMWSLCGRRATGVLEIVRRPVTRRLFLQDGRIVFASSSDPNDRLGEILLRTGKISLDQLESALRNLRSGKRLGVLLVDAGALDDADLVEAVVRQVKAVALDVLSWGEGDYRFDPGELPTQEVITLQVHTAELLLQGIRNVGSFSRIRSSVGAPHNAFCLTDNWREIREGLRLGEDEVLVVERLEKGSASVEELCDDLTLSDFGIYRTVWAFRVLGLIKEVDRSASGGSDALRTGRLLKNSFPEILIEMSRSRDTGVLYASRRNVERSFHLDRGRCVFATSTHPDDGLVSFLLRRGIISLSDREETRKRLLSNKRVGTILRELGVLDAKDLTQMVREQLSEIVYDTFLWDDGDYVFVPGPLPSNEQITLDVDVARLVAQGIRRVDSWTRVIQGCGGVDNPLTLTPGYLEVLDRMGAGVDEMGVANALKHPQSPRRVCRDLDGDDFRICQTLWAMKLVGGAETARIDLNEQIPSDLPAPPHPDLGAAAVGQQLADEVVAALQDLPDSADLISRHAIDADQVPRGAPAAVPTKLVPKDHTQVRGARPEPSAIDHSDSPEMLELEDLEEPECTEAEGSSIQLAAPTDAGAEAASDTPAPALQDLDELVGRFNAMHRLVYTAVKAEIGAGAVNFVRSCCGQAVTEIPDLLEEVELQVDGTWNEDGLKSAISLHGIDDPWEVCQRVLDREFGLLAPHLGQSRATELQERIWALQPGTRR